MNDFSERVAVTRVLQKPQHLHIPQEHSSMPTVPLHKYLVTRQQLQHYLYFENATLNL